MKTIMLIENNGQEKDEKAQVDFDDKTSWEYLFKVYWIYLKGKLSLTLDELTQATNPWKRANTTTPLVSQSTCVHNGDNDLKSLTPEISPQNLETSESKRQKTDEHIQKETVITKKPGANESKEWATKELLDFVAHMKNGDTSLLSQFDVQELMLEYIKRNNLRDPRKKSQILCDSRLKILFGKPRVGHFEMLKLLEFHFFLNEDLPKNTIKNIGKQVDPDWNLENMVTLGKDKKRRNHKKSEDRVPQNKLDDYAAIDVHNMNLIYLRRKLMENLIDNSEEFRVKVIGSIVRIRISGCDQKYDMYRLVQVVGTSKADAPYKIGNKSVDILLEVLNLDKKETVSIDTISNQDLSEDECRRLRQSVRCGLVKRFTVGDIQDKAVSLQSARLNDLMEAETLRLNNLRDRASEKGHKKDLREYVEKLQLLKTPEERERRLREIPEVHSDPKMNPDYETDDTEEHVQQMKPKHSRINHKNTNSPKKQPEFINNVTSSPLKNKPLRHLTIKPEEGSTHGSSGSVRPQTKVTSNGSTVTNRTHATSSSLNTPTSIDSDMEKLWHYRDPSGKIQGPFCKIQLQKWSTTGYFPVDMRIWMKNEDESLLLNDVLLKEESPIPTEKVGIGIEGLTVRIPIPSSTTVQIPKSIQPDLASPTPIENNSTDKVGIGIESLTVRIPIPSAAVKSTAPVLASPTPVEKENNSDVKHVSTVYDSSNVGMVDLPSPTPKTRNEDENVSGIGIGIGIPVQDAGNRNPANWSNGGGAEVSKTGGEWSGYSPTSGGGSVAEVGAGGDHGGLPLSLPPWQGVRETIEFSTLAEESVSDLLAEVDAMESQNGFPSPTSRRNNFVEDLFNGSFEDFSPTPRTDTHLPFQSTTTTTTTTAAAATTASLQPLPFKWPDIPEQTVSKNTIDLNNSTKVEANESRKPSPSPPPPPQPSPPPPQPRPGQEMATRVNPYLNVGWDPQQRMYSPRERSYKVEDMGYNRNGKPAWGRQGSFGGGSGGGYQRPPPKGKRVCKFYESGRCNKGASCNYWHP